VHEPLTSRPLTAHRTHLDALRNALAEGERSGAPTPFDFDAFLARVRTTNH
jgi:Arc/MetJ-type ribon-helix-helix transcriptional regulator